MQGLRTLIVGFLVAILPAATQYFSIVDWNTVFSFLGPNYAPTVATLVSGLIMVVMRLLTTTPVNTKSDGSKTLEKK